MTKKITQTGICFKPEIQLVVLCNAFRVAIFRRIGATFTSAVHEAVSLQTVLIIIGAARIPSLVYFYPHRSLHE